MKKIIIYDFDGTLTPYPAPKFEILEKCGIKNDTNNNELLDRAFKKSKENNTNIYSTIYEEYFNIIKSSGLALTDDNFCLGSDSVKYNKGVFEFFLYIKNKNVSNYLLSSGIKVYLEHVKVAPFFEDIYATTFKYDDNKKAIGLDYLMDRNNKVEAIKDIIKRIGNNDEDCSNMIYIGDGATDYYAMKYIKEHNGTTILVCNSFDSKSYIEMKDKNVVDFYTLTDYSIDSELFKYIDNLLNN